MKKEENSKSLMLGVPGIVLQMAGHFGGEGASDEAAPLYGLLILAGTVLLIWGLCYYAIARGRSGYWGLCGLLSIIGIIILACLRDEHQEAKLQEQEAELPAAEETEPVNSETAGLPLGSNFVSTDPTPPEDE